MKTRKISLTQLHAINWYGYADSIPVSGNLLLAGVTGSGKSILMDLLQYVLVGDRRLVKFNQSATGERSGRDLKSYVLGDLKEEDDGVEQYMRQSAITYAALEFTWPNEERIETWGLRVEFASAAEQQGRITPWWCKGRLSRADFLHTTEDGKRIPREIDDWRRVVEERGGELLGGIEEYRRDMSSPGHLNFDHEILSRLLPTAMSFTFLKSFNDFCRLFILPADRLDVSDVTTSYRTFKRYEEDLVELRIQLDDLRKIQVQYEAHIGFDRDAAIYRYLSAESSQLHTEAVCQTLNQKLTELRLIAEIETERLKKLDADIPVRREKIKELEQSIGEKPNGKIYLRIKSENKTLVSEISRLQETGNTLKSAFAARIRSAHNWANSASKLPLEIDTTAIDHVLIKVEAGGLSEAEKSLQQLCEAGKNLMREISLTARPNANRLADIRSQLAALNDEAGALKMGQLPFPTRVLDAINTNSRTSGSKPIARHLCQLCEVKDEEWRAAIEVAFTRKFAIVVEPEHYEQAEQIYHGLRNGQGRERESLVNPTKAINLARPVNPGSLAEKIETHHPIATALISHLFGDLICCERREQLREHNAAILSDGFSIRGAFIERVRHYDNMPFVGQRGLEQQLVWKNKLIDELEQEKRGLEPIERMVNEIQMEGQTQFEVPITLYQQLAQASQLADIQSKLENNITQLNSIDRDEFDKLEKSLRSLETELKQWEEEQRALLQNQKTKDINRLEQELKNATGEASKAKENFLNVSVERNYSEWLERMQELREELSEQLLESRARRFESLENEFRRHTDVARSELTGLRRLFTQKFPKFDDMSVETDDNSSFDAVLSKIEEADIPEYEQKSKDERQKWEQLFRTQVLEKLRAALGEVKNIISLLNTSLNKPIGTSRYFLKHMINPDYRIYHEMLDATAVAGSDLFASISDQQLRDCISRFLNTLIETPDGVEAARLLDYRHYYDYDMLVEDTTLPEEQRRSISVDKQSAKFSGGENQSPYFIAIVASYLRAYRRHGRYQDAPTLAVVPIDEAFSKLSGERISDCISALSQLELQGIFSMSTGNIPYAIEQCDHLIVVSKKEQRIGSRLRVRNIAVSIARESEEGRQFIQEFQ